MKKNIYLTFLLIVGAFSLHSQQFSGTGITIGGSSNWYWRIYRSGSGSFNQSLLFASAGSSSNENIRARLTQWGGLGLGTTSIAGTEYLAVGGNARINGNLDNKGNLYLNNIANQAGLLIVFDNTTQNNGADVELKIDTNSGSPKVNWFVKNWAGSYSFNRGMNNGSGGTTKRELFRIQSNGSIVVPDGNAIIDGKVVSEEVKVKIVDGPDYVFEKDYDLRSLEETETYIKNNKHLPEIPSAKEMEANGVQLGEMNMLLLKKIEELTLYVIEQNKKLLKQDELEKQIVQLNSYQTKLLKKLEEQNNRIDMQQREIEILKEK